MSTKGRRYHAHETHIAQSNSRSICGLVTAATLMCCGYAPELEEDWCMPPDLQAVEGKEIDRD